MPKERGKREATVLAGPALSGKTRRIISLFPAAGPSRPGAIIIVPDEAAGTAMRRALLAERDFLPTDTVVTLTGLARRTVALSGSAQVREAGFHERRLILHECVKSLSEAGEIPHLAEAAGFAGFYKAFVLFSSELASCRTSPADFARFAAENGARDRELALINSYYREALSDRGLCDREGLLEAARAALKAKAIPRAPRQVYVDGFTGWSENELGLLAALARGAEKVVITLPLEKDTRAGLFGRTREALDMLRGVFDVRVEWLGPCAEESAASHIARFFMAGDEEFERPRTEGAVRIISTAGARMEVREIAREAKRLILSGRAAPDIAVGIRGWETYGRLAVEEFRRLGVPLDSPRRFSPAGAPLLALLCDAVEVVRGGFDVVDMVRLLSSSYVNLERLSGGPLDSTDVMRIARMAGIVRGREQWHARLGALRKRLSSGSGQAYLDEDGEEQSAVPLDALRVEFLRNAFAFLEEELSALVEPAAVSVMARSFRAFLERLAIGGGILSTGVPEQFLYRDLASFSALKDALLLLESSGDSNVTLTAEEFLEILFGVMAGRGGSMGEENVGGVRLLDVSTLACQSAGVVFLCGATSASYPRLPAAGPFLSREKRERMASLGLVRETPARSLDSERLLFYRAATRARSTLYLTYPATSELGRPGLKSSYVDDIEALFTFEGEDRKDYGPSRVMVPLEEASSAPEAALAAAALVRGAADVLEVKRHAAAAVGVCPTFDISLRAGAIEARRESFSAFGAHDGVLSYSAAEIALRFPPERPWSGTQLSDYGLCPMRFFLNRVLKVERPEPPQPVPTALERGTLAHEILSRYFTELRNRDVLETLISHGPDEAAHGLFDAVSGGVLSRHERRRGLGDDPYWSIEKNRVETLLRDFVKDEFGRLRALTVDAGRQVPMFFELSFGLGNRGGEDEEQDSFSARDAVAVSNGDRREYLRGKIDRIDYYWPGDEEEGEPGLCIADYKLSGAPKKAGPEGLADMQMPVYLFAAPIVLKTATNAVPVEGRFLILKGGGNVRPEWSFGKTPYSEFVERFKAALFERVDSIRAGFFAPLPASSCPPYCPGQGVCRFNETRAERVEAGDE